MRTLNKLGKFLAVYQIIGGLAGIWILGSSLWQQGAFSVIGFAILMIPVLSLAAGILLAKGHPSGTGLSVLAQLVQVPYLKLQGFHYFAFLLFGLVVGVDPQKELLLHWFAGAGANFTIGDLPFRFAGLNVSAALILFLLSRTRAKPS